MSSAHISFITLSKTIFKSLNSMPWMSFYFNLFNQRNFWITTTSDTEFCLDSIHHPLLVVSSEHWVSFGPTILYFTQTHTVLKILLGQITKIIYRFASNTFWSICSFFNLALYHSEYTLTAHFTFASDLFFIFILFSSLIFSSVRNLNAHFLFTVM